MQSKKLKSRKLQRTHSGKYFTAFESIPGVLAIDSSKAKSHFSSVVRHVKGGGIVAFKRHDEPVGVLMSMGEYDRLRQASTRKLDLLTSQFDELVNSMQRPDFAHRAQKAFADMAERAPMPEVIAAVAPRNG